MSIKLMSAIYATKFTDLKDGAGNVTKASTAKQILLALADHANDDGKGAYPGLKTMVCKTALTRQCIIKTYDALKYSGMIKLEGVSKLGTNNYTINTGAFEKSFAESQPRLVVNPVDQGGAPDLPPQVNPVDQGSPPRLPPPVNPVDPNHPLTTIKPSREIDSDDFAKIWTELEQLCGAVPPNTARLIEVWIGKHPVERILQAISLARDKRAGSPKYVDQVLITWEANGYPPTREEQVLARAFKPAKGKNGIERTRYQIPNYSEADLALADEINRMSRLEKAGLVEP